MKFRVFLFFLARRMEWLSRTHPEFIAKLHGQDMAIQMRTADHHVQRYFRIHKNRVASRSGEYRAPTLTMTFADADYAFLLFTQGRKEGFMEGFQQGKIKIEGDFGQLMWFMSITKYLKPGAPKRKPEEPHTVS